MPTATGPSYHGVLSATTVMTVTLDDDYGFTEVLHRDPTSADPIYFTISGTAPVIGADGTYIVMPGGALQIGRPPRRAAGATAVQLIAASAVHFSVTGTNN